MNELLNNIHLKGASLWFLRLLLVLVTIVTGVFGVNALRLGLNPHEDQDLDDYLRLGFVLILLCVAAAAFLFWSFL